MTLDPLDHCVDRKTIRKRRHLSFSLITGSRGTIMVRILTTNRFKKFKKQKNPSGVAVMIKKCI